ncbi:MAG: hypothetical protein ABL971_01615 [Vicinamibacterales bacterium]
MNPGSAVENRNQSGANLGLVTGAILGYRAVTSTKGTLVYRASEREVP